MKYKASLDSTSKVVTAFVSVLFFAIIIVQLYLFIQHHNWTFLGVAVLLCLIYIITYFYHPVDYKIESQRIIIHRPGSDVTLLRSEIKNIAIVQDNQLRGTIRTFGVGGLFGYFGQFINHEMGCMTWYATKHNEKVVLIELNNHKKIILTPDEPEQFVEQSAMIA